VSAELRAKGTVLGGLGTFRLYLGFQWRDFPENLYIALSTHPLQNAQVWFRTINN